MSYLPSSELPAYRAGLADMLAGIETTSSACYFVTLAPNREWPSAHQAEAALRASVGELHARLDRKILGRRWCERPSSERTGGLWYYEHLRSNAHLHGVLWLPPGVWPEVIATMPTLVETTWADIQPAGSVVLEDLQDPLQAVLYGSKIDPASKFLLASELHAH